MSFRLEYAKSDRAVCKEKSCAEANVKIRKGGLKFGIWIGHENAQFFVWRHWGCVTEKQIKSVINDVGLEIDGVEDLTDEDQNRVATALACGYIAPEDATVMDEAEQARLEEYLADENRLKEMKIEFKAENKKFDIKIERQKLKDVRDARYTMEQGRVKLEEMAAKREAKEAKKAEKEAEKLAKKAAKEQEKPVKQEAKAAGKEPASRKRKQIKDEDDEGQDDAQALVPTKRARGRATVKKEESDDESEADEKQSKTKTSRGRRSAVKTEPTSDDEQEAVETTKAQPKARTSRGKKLQVKNEPISDGEDAEPTKMPESKPEVANSLKVEDGDQENEIPQETSRKSTRARKPAKLEESDNEEIDNDGAQDIVQQPAAKVKANTKVKRQIKTEPEADGASVADGIDTPVTNASRRATRRSTRNRSN